MDIASSMNRSPSGVREDLSRPRHRGADAGLLAAAAAVAARRRCRRRRRAATASLTVTVIDTLGPLRRRGGPRLALGHGQHRCRRQGNAAGGQRRAGDQRRQGGVRRAGEAGDAACRPQQRHPARDADPARRRRSTWRPSKAAAAPPARDGVKVTFPAGALVERVRRRGVRHDPDADDAGERGRSRRRRVSRRFRGLADRRGAGGDHELRHRRAAAAAGRPEAAARRRARRPRSSCRSTPACIRAAPRWRSATRSRSGR